jgi:hypothetical protein
VCGLEEPWNSQELLIESVGPVSLFCVFCHIVPICCFSVVLYFTDDYYDDDALDFSHWDNDDDSIVYFIPTIEDENELNFF